jgi:hypothetical protein
MEFQVIASIFVPRKGILSCFSSAENGSEQNSESLLLFLFHGTEFPAFFSSAEWFGTEFREFCSAEQLEFCRNKTIVYAVFCGINF